MDNNIFMANTVAEEQVSFDCKQWFPTNEIKMAQTAVKNLKFCCCWLIHLVHEDFPVVSLTNSQKKSKNDVDTGGCESFRNRQATFFVV